MQILNSSEKIGDTIITPSQVGDWKFLSHDVPIRVHVKTIC